MRRSHAFSLNFSRGDIPSRMASTRWRAGERFPTLKIGQGVTTTRRVELSSGRITGPPDLLADGAALSEIDATYLSGWFFLAMGWYFARSIDVILVSDVRYMIGLVCRAITEYSLGILRAVPLAPMMMRHCPPPSSIEPEELEKAR